MKRITRWAEDGQFPPKVKTHFACIECSNIPAFPDMRGFLIEHYANVLEKLCNSKFMQDHPVEVSNCLCAVQKNIRYTGGVKEANEAT